MNSCCLAGGMLAKEKGLGGMVGLVAGVADSDAGAESLGDVTEAGLLAESWRGRFGSGVAVVGSVCRLRPGMVTLATAERDSHRKNLSGESLTA